MTCQGGPADGGVDQSQRVLGGAAGVAVPGADQAGPALGAQLGDEPGACPVDGVERPVAEPVGYLRPEGDGSQGHELFAAVHPVTGDQLVTPWPLEAADMGYGPVRSLGWAASVAPRSARPVAVPWASRFGRSARGP